MVACKNSSKVIKPDLLGSILIHYQKKKEEEKETKGIKERREERKERKEPIRVNR